MNLETHIIESITQFNLMFQTLYDKSLVNNGLHLIGLDCEYITKDSYKESFEKANWVLDKNSIVVCKIQICAQNYCLIIDLCKLGPKLPENLINLLESGIWIKCGVGINEDIINLGVNYRLKQCNGVYDLKDLAILVGIKTPNLESLYNNLFDNHFKKQEKFTRSDWSKDMTVEQIKYASEDAYISYMVGDAMLKQLQKGLTNIIGITIEKVENKVVVNSGQVNWIGELQEYAQSINPSSLPLYVISQFQGTLIFNCKCTYGTHETNGKGPNKTIAKQESAKLMIELVKKIK